ncbi:MAG: glycosyltransferase [Pseudomonadales bacterium]
MTEKDIVLDGSLLAVSAQQWQQGSVPLVSVLVLAYNHEKYIVKCLNSILQQVTDFPIEIIINDDASTDQTSEIIRAYTQQFPNIFRPIFQTENQFSKFKKIRPALHNMAKGQFIAGCDGDDFWVDSKKLAKQVKFLQENPSYVLSFHDAIHVDEAGATGVAYNLPETAKRDYTQNELRILKWGWMLLGTMVYRKVPIEFPPEYELIPNGDNFVPMLLGAFGGARFQQDVGPLAYRQHQNSIWSAQPIEERLRMQLQSYLQITGYFVRIGDMESAKKMLLGRLRVFVERLLKLNKNSS